MAMHQHHNRAFYIGDDPLDVGSTITTATPHRVNPYHDEQGDTSSQKSYRKNCGSSWEGPVTLLGYGILLMLGWLLLVLLIGADALPGGGMFAILALILVSQLVGEATELVGFPSLVGMLLTGVVARSIGLYQVSGVYVKIVSMLREMSLAIILIKAGLGLDPETLRRMSFTVMTLAVCPGLSEAIAVAVSTFYILGYPWLWGFALGFLLCAISPAVVIPTLLKLKKEGYGEAKGISTLVIAASSIDDVLAISVFSICISVIFSTGESVASQMLQGPLDVCVGLLVGGLWGLLCGVLPLQNDAQVVTKRVLMVGGAGVCAVLGSPTVGYPGAGPLACITAAFVAAVLWAQQGWDISNIRVVTCSLVLVGGKLNFKEVVFVNLAWLPKATVQAALASQALDTARKAPVQNPSDLQRGAEVLTIAVLSILITAPLGAVGASFAGPRLLAKAHPSPASTPPPTAAASTGSEDQHAQ